MLKEYTPYTLCAMSKFPAAGCREFTKCKFSFPRAMSQAKAALHLANAARVNTPQLATGIFICF
jgi:hypothetical protein